MDEKETLKSDRVIFILDTILICSPYNTPSFSFSFILLRDGNLSDRVIRDQNKTGEG